MTQFAFSKDFFEPLSHARCSDPDTSHIAATKARTFIKGHAALVLEALRTYGPMTVDEIAVGTGLQSQQVNKRTADLQEAGLIAVATAFGHDMTRPSSSGRPARVWCAVTST